MSVENATSEKKVTLPNLIQAFHSSNLERITELPQDTKKVIRKAIQVITFQFRKISSIKDSAVFKIILQTVLKIATELTRKTSRGATFVLHQAPNTLRDALTIVQKFESELTEDEKPAFKKATTFLGKLVTLLKKLADSSPTESSAKTEEEVASKPKYKTVREILKNEEAAEKLKQEAKIQEEDVEDVSDVPDEEEDVGTQLGDPTLPSILRIGIDSTSDYINLKAGRLNNTGLRQGPYLVYKNDFLKSNYNVRSQEQVKAMQTAFGVSRISGEQPPIVGYIAQNCRFPGIDLVAKALAYRLRMLDESIVQMTSAGQRIAVLKHKAEWIRETIASLSSAKKPCPPKGAKQATNGQPSQGNQGNRTGRPCGDDLNLVRDLVYVLILLKGNAEPGVQKQLESIKLKTILNAARRGDIAEQRRGLSSALDILLKLVNTKVELSEDQVQQFLKPIYKYLRPTYEVPELVRLKDHIFPAIDELTGCLKTAADTQKQIESLHSQLQATQRSLTSTEEKLNAARETETATAEVFLDAKKHLDMAKLTVVTLQSEKENLRTQLQSAYDQAEADYKAHTSKLTDLETTLEATRKIEETTAASLAAAVTAGAAEKAELEAKLIEAQTNHTQTLASITKAAKEAADDAKLLQTIQDQLIEDLIQKVDSTDADKAATKAALEQQLEAEKQKLDNLQTAQMAMKEIYQRQLEEFKASLEELESHKAKVEGKKNRATSLISKQVKEIRGLTAERNTAKTTLNATKAEVERLSQALGSLVVASSDEATKAKAELEAVQAALTDLQASSVFALGEKEAEFEALQETLKEIQRTSASALEEKEDELRALQESLAKLQETSAASLTDHASELATVQAALEALQTSSSSALTNKNAELASLNQVLQSLRESSSDSMREKEQKFNELESSFEALKQSSEQAAEESTVQLSALQTRFNDLQTSSTEALRAKNVQLSELQSALTELKRISSLALNTKTKEFEDLQATLKKVTNTAEGNAGAKNAKLRSMEETLQQLKDDSSKELQAKVQELEAVQSLLQALEGSSTVALGEKDTELARLAGVIESMKQESATTGSAKNTELAAMKNELQKVKNLSGSELQAKTNALNTLQRRLNDLHSTATKQKENGEKESVELKQALNALRESSEAALGEKTAELASLQSALQELKRSSAAEQDAKEKELHELKSTLKKLSETASATAGAKNSALQSMQNTLAQVQAEAALTLQEKNTQLENLESTLKALEGSSAVERGEKDAELARLAAVIESMQEQSTKNLGSKNVQLNTLTRSLEELKNLSAAQLKTKERELKNLQDTFAAWKESTTQSQQEANTESDALKKALEELREGSAAELAEKDTELEELRATLTSLQTETSSDVAQKLRDIASLQVQLDSVQSELAAAQEAKDAAEKEATAAIAAAKAEADLRIAEAMEAIATTNKELLEAKAHAEEAVTLAEQAAAESGTSSEQAKEAKAKAEAAQAEVAEAKAAAEAAEAAKDTAQAEHAAATAAFEQQLSELRAELAATQSALKASQESLEATEQRAASAEQILETTEATTSAAIAATDASNQELLARMTTLEEQVTQCESVQAQLNEILSDGVNGINTPARVRALLQQLKGVQDTLESTTAQGEEAKLAQQAKIAELEAEKAALNSKMERLQQSLEKLSTEHGTAVSELRTSLGEKDIELAGLKAHLSTLTDENDVLREKASRVNAMEANLTLAKELLKTSEDAVASEAKRVVELERELGEVRAAKTAAESESISLREATRRETEVRAELDQLKQRQADELAARNTDIAGKQQTIQQLEKDLAEAQRTISEAQAQRNTVQTQLENTLKQRTTNMSTIADLTQQLTNAKATAYAANSAVRPVLQLLGVTSTDAIVPALEAKLKTIKELEDTLSGKEDEMKTRLRTVLATLLVNPEQADSIGRFIFRGEGDVESLKANAELCEFFTYLYSIINYQMYRIRLAFPKDIVIQKDIFFMIKKKNQDKHTELSQDPAVLVNEISRLFSKIFTKFGKTSSIPPGQTLDVDKLPHLYEIFNPETGYLAGYKGDPFVTKHVLPLLTEFGRFMDGVLDPVEGSGAQKFRVRSANLDTSVFKNNSDSLVPLTLLYVKLIQLVNELFTEKYDWLLQDCGIVKKKEIAPTSSSIPKTSLTDYNELLKQVPNSRSTETGELRGGGGGLTHSQNVHLKKVLTNLRGEAIDVNELWELHNKSAKGTQRIGSPEEILTYVEFKIASPENESWRLIDGHLVKYVPPKHPKADTFHTQGSIDVL